MSFYSRMQQTTNKLLQGKGQAVTLTKVVPGTYDPATGGVTNTSTTQTGTGAIFEYSTKDGGIFNVPGSLVKEGDKKLLLSALNSAGAALTAPQADDTVSVNGTVFTITQVKTLSPAGTVIMYECNIRGV